MEASMAKFIPFLVVGDPNLEISREVIEILIDEGADAIELGVPFSDALADGPVIQAASERAATRVSLKQVLEFAESVLKKHPRFPFVLFTYYNPILKMGLFHFVNEAKRVGIHAVLVVDLPPEASASYQGLMREAGVKTVFLASPTSTPERMKLIADASTGFIYYVSRTGVTGVQNEVSLTLKKEVEALRKITTLPIAVGFGISNGLQAAQVAQIADSVVVGSAFVKLISETTSAQGANQSTVFESIRKLAREIKSGCETEQKKN